MFLFLRSFDRVIKKSLDQRFSKWPVGTHAALLKTPVCVCVCVLQAVKFEPYHDSGLVRFLLKRALRVSRVNIGLLHLQSALPLLMFPEFVLRSLHRASVSATFSSGSCAARSPSPCIISRGTLSCWRPTWEAAVKTCCRTSGNRWAISRLYLITAKMLIPDEIVGWSRRFSSYITNPRFGSRGFIACTAYNTLYPESLEEREPYEL